MGLEIRPELASDFPAVRRVVAAAFGSDTEAAPTPEGGYAFTGRKIFTSLAPAWTRLGVFGLDDTERVAPTQRVLAATDRLLVLALLRNALQLAGGVLAGDQLVDEGAGRSSRAGHQGGSDAESIDGRATQGGDLPLVKVAGDDDAGV